MYSPTTILSENSKCGCSLNLPIAGHCRPTPNCARCCYARSGHTALPASKHKQVYTSKYLAGNNIDRLIEEARTWPAVRLSGTGDLSLDHCKNLIRLAASVPRTMFWGMTRKIEIANEINHKLPNLKLMVSVDSSSPKSVWKYPGAMCWGPRLASDVVPDDPRIHTVFPYHRSGRVINGVPHDRRDCRAVWHEISGCQVCGRCWNWKA